MVALRHDPGGHHARQLWPRVMPGDDWPGDHHHYWCAWDGDHLVGLCSAVRLEAEPSVVFLSSTAVLRTHRGRGLQRRMVRHRIRWARRQGARVVITYTRNDNWPSAANLVREGFQWYAPARSWAGAGMWYFRRDL